MIGIYKITSPIGAIYIGQSWDISQRQKTYSNLSCKKQIKLYNSLFKYGWENHTFEVLEKFNNISQVNLDDKELYYYNKYNNGNLLNILKPGNGNGRHHKETKDKISNSKLRPITQFDISGNVLNHWSSTIEASVNLKIKKTSIAANLSNRTLFCHKVFFFRKGIINNIVEPPKKKDYKKNRKKRVLKPLNYPIYQYTTEFVFLKTWVNAKEASIALKLSQRSISQAANGSIYTSGGFRWRNKFNKDDFTKYK